MRVSDRGASGVHDTWQINYCFFFLFKIFIPWKQTTDARRNVDRRMRFRGGGKISTVEEGLVAACS